jgi:hypothetical protein
MGTYGDLMKLNKAPKAQQTEPTPPSPAEVDQPVAQEFPLTLLARTNKSKRPRKPDSTQSGNQDIMLSRYPDSMIESIRKAVRFVGKDPFFGRFTPEEKSLLADIAYNHKRKGIKTSENEIARIAVNFIAHDHQEKGKDSILSRVLEALNT